MKTSALWAVISLCVGCREAPAERVAAPAPPSVNQTLDELDDRRGVPLLPMMAHHQKQSMREHLEAVEQIVAAAAASDFDQVGVAAKRLGLSETMGRMCEHLGAGAPGFTEQALAFHRTADEIAVAATRRDHAGVLASLSKTLRACTSCHATYKQQLVASLPD